VVDSEYVCDFVIERLALLVIHCLPLRRNDSAPLIGGVLPSFGPLERYLDNSSSRLVVFDPDITTEFVNQVLDEI